jgi:hypothetical protein
LLLACGKTTLLPSIEGLGAPRKSPGDDTMAGKLGGDNVTQLPTRAARGAGKSKPRAAPPKVRPAIPVGRAGVRANPSSVGQEKALREALQLQLIGLRSKHTQVDQKMDAKRAELKELNETRKMIRAAIEKAGMPLALFDEAYEDGKTSRVDLQRKEASRFIIREAYGVPIGRQGELFGDDKKPELVRSAEYWEAEGYRAGISILDPEDMPKPPPEHITDFQRGVNSATSRNAAGLKEVAKATRQARTPVADPTKADKPEGELLKAAGGDEPERHDDEEEGIEDEEEEQARENPPIAPGAPAPDVETAPAGSAVVH